MYSSVQCALVTFPRVLTFGTQFTRFRIWLACHLVSCIQIVWLCCFGLLRAPIGPAVTRVAEAANIEYIGLYQFLGLNLHFHGLHCLQLKGHIRALNPPNPGRLEAADGSAGYLIFAPVIHFLRLLSWMWHESVLKS